MKTVKYSRVWLLALTLLDLVCILLSGFIMQSPLLAIKLLGILVLFAATMGAALISREWVIPSRIQRQDDDVIIQWNNWELQGRLTEKQTFGQRPKCIRIKVSGHKITLYPVGPMFILAGLMIDPLRRRLPHLLNRTYFYSREKLELQLTKDPETSDAVLDIPLILLGKRKVKKWLG